MSRKFLDFTGSKEELVQELKMYLHHFREDEEVLVEANNYLYDLVKNLRAEQSKERQDMNRLHAKVLRNHYDLGQTMTHVEYPPNIEDEYFAGKVLPCVIERVNRTKVLIRVEKVINEGRDSQWRQSVTHSVPASWIDTKDLDKLPIVTKVE